MIVSTSAHAPLRLLHRLLAAGSAALVLLLTVLAVSPQLHADLHAADAAHGHHHGHDHTHSHPHDAAPSDEGCVVTLFASGVTAAPAPLVVAAPPVARAVVTFAPRADIFVSPPRYLHQPERGPPVG